MTLFQAIIAGMVQGITEFLPISSSGHMLVLRELFHIELESLTFDIAVHLATLLAVVWVLRSDLIDLLRVFFSKKLFQSLGFKVVIATVPAVAFGLFLHGEALLAIRTAQIVAISLIVWGVFLLIADFVSRRYKKQVKSMEQISWLRAVLIGIAQAIALIPGTSRSGITMMAGLFLGIDRQRAANFSFLLSVPVIAGAGVLTSLDVLQTGLDIDWFILVAGCLSAFFFGIIAIRFLLSFLSHGTFFGFALYRIILGIFILMML